jgi:CHAT domain-containing protein/Tfp pilus assembly protein PilF
VASRRADSYRVAWLLPALTLTVLTVASVSCSRRQQAVDLGDRAIVLPPAGQAIELELAGGERRILSADLAASTYLQMVIETADADLDLRLIGPTREVNGIGRVRRDGRTPVSLLAERAGVYCLEISSAESEDALLSLTIHVAEKRPARADDRDRVRAERLFSEAEALRLHYEVHDGEMALDKYETCRATWRRTGDFDEAARASQRIGTIYERTGDLDIAERHYQDGLRFAREAANRELESELLSAVGGAHILLGDHEEAGRECREALSQAERNDSSRGQALATNCLGEVEYHLGNLEEAITFYGQAEALWRAVGDRGGVAQTLLYLGYSYSDLSEFDRASVYYRDALSQWKLAQDRRGQALTLLASGRLHLRLGEHQIALNAFDEAMQLVERMGDSVWQASVYAGLGSVYSQMGENERARVYWDRSLNLFRKAGLQMAEVEVMQSVGETYLASGEPDEALTHFEEALDLTRQLENPRWEAHSLRLIGLAYESMGEPGKAVSSFRQSLAVERSGGDLRYDAYTLGDLGRAYQGMGEYDLALESFNRARDLSRASRDRLGEAIALFNLARFESQRGMSNEARHYLEDTLRIAESLRAGIDSHELRSSYLASIQLYYKLHIELLMRLHSERPSDRLDALAFEASERARARSLLESLNEAGVDIRQGVDPGLLARERQLKRTLDGKAERQLRLGGRADNDAELEALAIEIRDLTARYDQLQAEIRSKSPRYAALTQPDPLDLEAVQRQVLDEQTLLLEYSLGEERSFLWAVERGTHSSIELPPASEIEKASREVYRMLTARLPRPEETVREYRRRVKEADAGYWEAASRLGEMLLGPVADRLSGKRIVVVGDGALQYVPFAALPVPRRGGEPVPMIVEHEVVNLPSVSAFAVLRRESLGREEPRLSVAVLADPVFELDDPRLASKASASEQAISPESGARRALRDIGLSRGIGLGIPRLVSTRWEADAILATAPKGTTLRALDFEASRETAMSPELAQYRIIHFATHGVVNNEEPGLSGIVLSMVDEDGNPTNGFVRLDDIYNLDLPADLVVLSACNSALGKPVDGEGLVGIVRGFMYAGAKRVVASLWKVDDEATGELMGRFYREMFQGKLPPAAALRNAQIDMWRQEEWTPPFYWAAFVLQGEWL